MMELITKFDEEVVVKNHVGHVIYRYNIIGELMMEDWRRYKLYLRCGNNAVASAFQADNDDKAIAQVNAFIRSQIEPIMDSARRIGGYPIDGDCKRN